MKTVNALLEHKRNRLNGIIELIKDVLEGVNTMSFEAFNQQDIKKMIETMRSGLSEEEFQAFIKEYGGGDIEKYEEILLKSLTDEKVSSDILRWYRSKENFINASKPPHNTEQAKNDIMECSYKYRLESL